MNITILIDVLNGVSLKDLFVNVAPIASPIIVVIIGYYYDKKLKSIENSNNEKLLELESIYSKKMVRYEDLSENHKAIIEVIPKFISNYYINTESTVEGILSRLTKAFEDTDYYKKKRNTIKNAQNQLIYLNTEIFTSTTSVEVIKLLTWNMQHIYKQKENDENKSSSIILCYWSVLYKYLVKDYKNIIIDDDALLKMCISDYEEEKYINEFNSLNETLK